MTVLRAHKIKINPTSEQEQWLLQAVGVCRFVFNWGLDEWKRQYESGEKPSSYALKKQFNSIKREKYPWVYNVSKTAVDSGFLKLDKAFKNFFRRCKNGDKNKGYPKFKSRKSKHQSFTMDGARIKLDGYWIKLEKLSTKINMTEEFRFDGRILSATISTDGTCWFISLLAEVEKPKYHKHQKEFVGIDLGIETLATLSDGKRYENQRFLKSDLRKIKRLSRELSRRQKDSNRWKSTKRKLSKSYKKISNRRLDYLHKMTAEIAKTYKIIGMEDLNVSGMTKNHRLSQALSDVSFGVITEQINYKAAWFGGLLIKVDRYFPSSKLCNSCGKKKDDLKLSDRQFYCECGYENNRDYNASLNIKNEALRMVAEVGSQTPKTDMDGDVRPLAATLREVSKYG